MMYATFKKMWQHRDRYLIGHNNVTGGADQTTDPVVTRDPNDYLMPRIDGQRTVYVIAAIVGILAIIILLPSAIKTIKSVNP